MAAKKCKCPECSLLFEVPPGASGSISCPICDTRIPLPEEALAPGARALGARPLARPGLAGDSSAAPVATPGKTKAPRAGNGFVPASFKSPPARNGVEEPSVTKSADPGQDSPEAARGQSRTAAIVFLSAIGIGLLAGAAGAVVIALAILRGGDNKDLRAVSSSSKSPSDPPPPSRVPEALPSVASASGGSDSASPSPPQKFALPAELQKKVNAASERGRDFLYEAVRSGKVMDFDSNRHFPGGSLALAAWTLLECGVRPDDKLIEAKADVLRGLCANSGQTYGMVCAVLFLDRLAEARRALNLPVDPGDDVLIRNIALRLIAGQKGDGSWNYNSDFVGTLTAQDEQKVFDYLSSAALDPDVLAGKGSRAPGTDPELLPKVARNWRIVKWIRSGWAGNRVPDRGDNSNTQFGLLGLWVARRHGAPADASLAFAEQHFRKTQSGGGWNYAGPDGTNSQNWPDSMTCAGLLGLAVGRVVRGTNDDGDDSALKKGLGYLGNALSRQRRGAGIASASLSDFYYIWSLERVAMILDVEKIGGNDWYRWAAESLLELQRPDGSWHDRALPPEINTSFALLVLKRVNVAKDATAHLKKLINVKDLERNKE